MVIPLGQCEHFNQVGTFKEPHFYVMPINTLLEIFFLLQINLVSSYVIQQQKSKTKEPHLKNKKFQHKMN